MIADATFKKKRMYDGKNLSRYWRSYWNSEMGNCYGFNDQSKLETIKSQIPGPNGGLSLELNVEENEYLPTLSRDIGARFFICF